MGFIQSTEYLGRRDGSYRSTVCFSLLESCGAASLRSEGPRALTRLADDELRVPAVMALNNSTENEREGW